MKKQTKETKETYLRGFLKGYVCKQCGAFINDRASEKDLASQFFCSPECQTKFDERYKKHISQFDQRPPIKETEY